MYRFALRPRWILSHLLVVAIVGACIWAGFWQLRRLDEKRTVIDRFEDRSVMDVVPLTDLLDVASDDADVDAVALRPVVVTGTYLPDEEVTVRNRSLDGAPGHWVLTPLLMPDGTAVVVNRGWVPLAVLEDLDRAAPPAGEVTVTGALTASQERGRLGAADAAEGDLVDLARADVGRIAAEMDVPVLPAYVTLAAQDPPVGDIPTPVEVVEPDEGPHMGYAVQWFIFAAIAAGGYPLILRRVARDRAVEEAHPDGPPRTRRRSSLVPVDD